MKFDMTISVGNLLVAGGFLGSLILMHVANIKRIQSIETKLDILMNWFVQNVINSSKDIHGQ